MSNKLHCHRCREPIDGWINKRRYGFWDEEAQNFEQHGGIERSFCEECWNQNEAREPAAYVKPRGTPEIVIQILQGSHGALVADFKHYFVGGRPFVRWLDGEWQGMTITAEGDREKGELYFVPKKMEVEREWLVRHIRSDTGTPEDWPVMFKPPEETPFEEWDTAAWVDKPKASS